MRRICERLLNFVQVIDHRGTVRLCGWLQDNVIGALTEKSMKEIWHGEYASQLRSRLMEGDYSQCIVDACPYLAMDDLESHLIEVDELQEYPEELHLAYENVCNYRCTSCTVPGMMQRNRTENLKQSYDIIEQRLEEVLPHIKRISANGCGELFVSKRILKLLADWKPLAPAEEVEVMLETNGSLFDEIHWKQIENLGQYYLSVSITVMSFDEPAYQFLSGTTLPITQIESNLHFVKGLREKGIVNYFEIATVVQERNFRFLPEFARRCVEEFGADYVRLRPYMPWGADRPEIEWFADIRNPKHPYYMEYKKVMENKIFSHPLVHDWSGGKDSECSKGFPNSFSSKVFYLKEQILADIVLNTEKVMKKIKNSINGDKIIVYGLGNIGKVLLMKLEEYGIKPECALDKYQSEGVFGKVTVCRPEQAVSTSPNTDIVITPLTQTGLISEELKALGYTGRIIWLGNMLSDEGLVSEVTKAVK